MPCPFVVFARRKSSEISKESGDKVRRAGEDQSDSIVEPQGADNSGEEIVERTSRKMHVLDKTEEPEARVANRLLEAGPSTLALREADSIPHHAIVSKLSFLGLQPAGSEWVVGKCKHADDSDAEGQAALDDEKPLPPFQTLVAINSVEDSSRDETGK